MPTLLIVDDEEMVRTCVARVMERQGWTAVTAADGAAALRAIENRDVDVVLADILMPGMNGVELLDVLQSAKPDVRVLFMSGHPHQFQRPPVPLPCWSASPDVIAKPFTLGALARKVTSLVQAGSHGSAG